MGRRQPPPRVTDLPETLTPEPRRRGAGGARLTTEEKLARLAEQKDRILAEGERRIREQRIKDGLVLDPQRAKEIFNDIRSLRRLLKLVEKYEIDRASHIPGVIEELDEELTKLCELPTELPDEAIEEIDTSDEADAEDEAAA